jgi:hypothetical protein
LRFLRKVTLLSITIPDIAPKMDATSQDADHLKSAFYGGTALKKTHRNCKHSFQWSFVSIFDLQRSDESSIKTMT